MFFTPDCFLFCPIEKSQKTHNKTSLYWGEPGIDPSPPADILPQQHNVLRRAITRTQATPRVRHGPPRVGRVGFLRGSKLQLEPRLGFMIFMHEDLTISYMLFLQTVTLLGSTQGREVPRSSRPKTSFEPATLLGSTQGKGIPSLVNQVSPRFLLTLPREGSPPPPGVQGAPEGATHPSRPRPPLESSREGHTWTHLSGTLL